MNVLGFNITKKRGTSEVRSSATLQDFFQTFSMGSATGINVTPENALSFSAVYACIKVISETVSQISIDVYKLIPQGRQTDYNNPLQYVIHTAPNETMTSSTFHQALLVNVLGHGNGYARIIRNNKRIVTELLLLDPRKVTPKISADGKSLFYKIKGIAKELSSDDIIHIPALSFDGVLGKSPLAVHAQAVGLGLAEQEFAARYFKNGAVVSGVITRPGTMEMDAAEKLRKSWNQIYGSLTNAHRTAVLDAGMDYKQIGNDPEKSQLVLSRKFSIKEIARIYRVPPHMIADLEDATNNNIEHQSLEFAKYTLMPWIRKIEQEYNRKLFKTADRGKYITRFNVESLMRGDTQARAEYYVKAIQNGWMSPNEVRQLEGLNKRDGGDIYLTPLNMTTNPENNGKE
jgi:HK97 family phage portal protein